LETVNDTDSDGLFDVFDNDDDNDGVPTENELLVNDTAQNTDGDTRPDHLDIDDDNDGILTENESINDTDGDGNVDYLDQDADNDGISDNVEGQLTNGYVAPSGTDADGDGLDNAYDDHTGYVNSNGINPVDTDGDGTDDVVDTDSDNDGVDDHTEAYDTDHNGVANTNCTSDADNDGLNDCYDTITGYTDPNGFLNSGANSTNNTDGTDEPDFRDLDDDNDGIPTGDFEGEDSIIEDCDNDDIPNYLDPESCDLIPNAFSPGNGDGINDTWAIPYLTQFPDFKLEIYDRWGNIVYEYARNNASHNAIQWWNGTSNGRLNFQGGELLPAGTYFYIMYPNEGDKQPVTGWVYLNR
jgi:gliding motility-associated-like protein